jgi:hypothetical protein
MFSYFAGVVVCSGHIISAVSAFQQSWCSCLSKVSVRRFSTCYGSWTRLVKIPPQIIGQKIVYTVITQSAIQNTFGKQIECVLAITLPLSLM